MVYGTISWLILANVKFYLLLCLKAETAYFEIDQIWPLAAVLSRDVPICSILCLHIVPKTKPTVATSSASHDARLLVNLLLSVTSTQDMSGEATPAAFQCLCLPLDLSEEDDAGGTY